MPGRVTAEEATSYRSEYSHGDSITTIASRHGRSTDTIHRWLLKGDVRMRTSGEGVSLKMTLGRMPKPPVHRTHTIDHDVFNRDLSPETAWLLGLIVADGCVRARGSLLLALGPDRDLADKGSAILGTSKAPFERNNCWMVEVASTRLVASLVARGVKPAKTHNLHFPEVPSPLLPHFVRGAWEGDGTMYWNGSKPMIAYTSATHDFVQRMSQVLYENAGVRPAKVSTSKRCNTHSVRYRGQSAMKVARWMYDESEDHIRSNRKFSIFNDFVGGVE